METQYELSGETVPKTDRTLVLVLVPPGQIDEDALVDALTDLAAQPVSEIRFVGLESDEPGSRMASTMDSLVLKTQRLPVEVCRQHSLGQSRLRTARTVATASGPIVGYTDQRAGPMGEGQKETTCFPVHQACGPRVTLLSRVVRGFGRLAFETFPLAVVGGFFWLEAYLGAQTGGLLNTFVMIVLTVIELGLIFLWSLFIS